MPTTIIHKIGSGVPDATDLVVGEIAQDENTGTLYVKKKDESVVPVGSAGAGMVISATEPSDPVTGLQWLDVGGDEPYVWIFDEDKWVEFPAGKTSGGSDTTYTLPVAVRGDEIQLPLNEDSSALIVDTRSGPVELPLMAA